MRIKYIMFATKSHSASTLTTARLYGTPLIYASGAGPPKVIGPREGHEGEQYIIA